MKCIKDTAKPIFVGILGPCQRSAVVYGGNYAAVNTLLREKRNF